MCLACRIQDSITAIDLAKGDPSVRDCERIPSSRRETPEDESDRNAVKARPNAPARPPPPPEDARLPEAAGERHDQNNRHRRDRRSIGGPPSSSFFHLPPPSLSLSLSLSLP